MRSSLAEILIPLIFFLSKISLNHRGSLPGLHQTVFDDIPGSLPEHVSMRSPYRCLDSILPYLNGLLSAEEASEMLEIYFNEKHNSIFKSTSPYLLAHVLHPTSVLHPTNPRPTSSALLAVILFCVAQTADMKIFDTPGARERMSVDLYRLSLDMLQSEDPDNYFRTSGKNFTPHSLRRSLLILSRWLAISPPSQRWHAK